MIANNAASSLQGSAQPQGARIDSPRITKFVGSSTRPMTDPYGPSRSSRQDDQGRHRVG